MPRVWVVGSGASGVHFARTLLDKNYDVTMIDLGYRGSPPLAPEAGFESLKKSTLNDPVQYFLGKQYEGVVLPGAFGEYYGIPPSRQFAIRHPRDFGYSAEGFAPLFSFARGGLAEIWTGGSYPLNDTELEGFPFSYRDIEPFYDEIAARIGISGTGDDLARYLPIHKHLMPPLDLDAHSSKLLETYERKRSEINDELGVVMGRSRIATLSEALGSRDPCSYLGRCIWGCPVGALYTPSQTLRECRAHPRFAYMDGWYVRHFEVDDKRRVTSIVAQPKDGGNPQTFSVDTLALAAGTLSTSRIFLESVYRKTGEVPRLEGLMDNRQLFIPFVNLHMLGSQYSPDSYQYHLLSMGIEVSRPAGYVHAQVTALTTALMHPFIQKIPFDLETSTFLTRALHAALGLINVNFHDTPRAENYVTLSAEASGSTPEPVPRLQIHYAPSTDEPARVREATKKIRKTLRKLGCVVPPGMIRLRPMGASVHYAGTLPMSADARPWTTTDLCRSHDFENLYLVDGSVMPRLPAKNLTFTLMANAVRVATLAF